MTRGGGKGVSGQVSGRGHARRPDPQNLHTCYAPCATCQKDIPEDGTCHAVAWPGNADYDLYHAACCPLPHPHPGRPGATTP